MSDVIGYVVFTVLGGLTGFAIALAIGAWHYWQDERKALNRRKKSTRKPYRYRSED